MSLKPIPLTADPQDPDSPKGAIPVDIYGVSGGGGGAVDSVNGQTGIVSLGAGDVGAAPVDHGHVVGDVDGLQAALDGKQPTGDYLSEGDLPAPPDLSPYAKTSDLASVATSGSYDDLGDKPDIPSTPGDVGARPAGDVPWGEVADKPATFPPAAHTHSISDVTGLQTALDDLDDAIGDVGAVLDAILEGTP